MSKCNCYDYSEGNCQHCTDLEEENTPSTFGRLPPAPPFQRTNEQFEQAFHKSFDQYGPNPNLRMNMPMLVTLMARHLEVTPVHWREAQDQILDYLRSLESVGKVNITKGKNGGVSRNSQPPIETKMTIGGPVRFVGETIKVDPPKAINDHTCPHCGNTACSKTERSCWKCGGSL